MLNELQKLKGLSRKQKACQGRDIPVKIIKENINIITDFNYNNFNNSLFSSCFPSDLKNPLKKRLVKTLKTTTL